jgi:L-2-hydroxyglutarate oxidase
MADFFVNAAGLASDKVARLARLDAGLSIVPFKGEYLSLEGQSKSLVNGLIYPVPNPELPFLGLHLTRMLDGELHAGPNATLALGREAYGRWGVQVKDLLGIVKTPGLRRFAWRHRKFAIGELYRSLSLNATARALQLLVPAVNKQDLTRVEAGIRAQALSADGQLVDDFVIKSLTRQVHILNAPSPAATSSLAIAMKISTLVQEQLN